MHALKRVHLRSRDCQAPLPQDDARLAKAQQRFRSTLATGGAVHCAACDRRMRSLAGAYFVILSTPTGSDVLAVACCDICLRRAIAHGVV